MRLLTQSVKSVALSVIQGMLWQANFQKAARNAHSVLMNEQSKYACGEYSEHSLAE